jgi:hypothetical protein
MSGSILVASYLPFQGRRFASGDLLLKAKPLLFALGLDPFIALQCWRLLLRISYSVIREVVIGVLQRKLMSATPSSKDLPVQATLQTQPYVLGFVGENENGILRWWTEKILAALAGQGGLSQQLIDLKDAGWREKLSACLSVAKPEFCFSFQGIGMELRLEDGSNLWIRNAIPFLSYLGDSPYHAPLLHAVQGPGMYLLYSCADFLHLYKDFLKGRAFASTLRCGYPENPLADRTPWNQREHDLVFVKTGVDSKALSRQWDASPRRIRDILYDCSARVLSGTDETVQALCAQVFADRQIYWGEQQELFLSTCSMVDRYARAVRAERMVRALMRHKALIVGDWSHLDQSNSRAVFCSPIAADRLDALYASTRITVNTLPAVRFGIHERVMAGLLAKAAVISEATPFLRHELRNCPSFLGVNIDQDTFQDELDHTLNSCLDNAASAEQVQVSAMVAREIFSFENFIQQLIDYVAIEKYRRQLNWWSFPPRAN